MRKAIKNIYRIREDRDSDWERTYRPEYLENWVWKPTHTFSFTWRPFYTSDYDKAVNCIKNHKDPSTTIYHYDIKEKEERDVEAIEEENLKKKSKFWEVIWILFLAFALWGTGFLLGSALTCTCN